MGRVALPRTSRPIGSLLPDDQWAVAAGSFVAVSSKSPRDVGGLTYGLRRQQHLADVRAWESGGGVTS
jgi:hypothetical protein